MKESKRKPIIDFNKIKSLSSEAKIQGNILFSLYTERETLFILTDMTFFYFKEKEKRMKEFMLIPFLSKEPDKYQTDKNRWNHLWCDKYNFHTIIYYDKRVFYFNPTFSEPKEIDIIDKTIQNGKYLEPYAVAFLENSKNELDKEKFEIIFSDYYSDIYSLNIDINEMKIQPNLLYRIRKNFTHSEDDFNFNDLDLFNLEKSEIITDIKILNDEVKDEKEIIAVTKNSIFKFKGNGTYKEIFDEYSNKDNMYDNF
jgi:hypothetical protein